MKKKYFLVAFLCIMHCGANGMMMNGEQITTKAGTIKFSELIALPEQIKSLRNFYFLTTACIVGYLIYEKFASKRKEQLRAQPVLSN